MKKTIILLLTFVFITFIGFSQNTKDTTNKQVKKIEKTIIITSDNEGNENVMIGDDGPMCKHMGTVNKNCCGKCSKHMKFMKNENFEMHKGYMKSHQSVGWAKKAFVLMPIFLFLFFFLIFIFWLRRENYKLSDALSSKLPEVLKTSHTRPDPSDSSKTITEIKEEIYYPRSTSKLIAFFTGITAIIIAICGISYFAYFSLTQSGSVHHHCGLWVIVLVLFVGMIPYTINSMFKK